MGFDLWLGGAMPSEGSHKQLLLAELSFTLSKHWFCHYKPACTSVHHSQQALLLDAHPI